MTDSFVVITVWRGRDSATYLAKDWEKYGDIELQDIDGFMKHRRLTKDDIKPVDGKWDLEALKKLMDKADEPL